MRLIFLTCLAYGERTKSLEDTGIKFHKNSCLKDIGGLGMDLSYVTYAFTPNISSKEAQDTLLSLMSGEVH